MHSDICEALEAIGRELKALGLWGGKEGRPDESAFRSTVPFFADTMEFHQWLEYVLIPKMGDLARRGAPIPKTAVLPAGEAIYSGMLRTHRALLKALMDLDRACAGHSEER